MYQRTRLSDLTALDAPGDLPDWLVTLGASDAQIRDTTWAGYPDEGYWPVSYATPVFDAAVRVLTGGLASYKADRKARAWAGVYAVRDLTAEEIAARDPAMPDISDRQFARGLWGDTIITYDDFLGFIGPGAIPPPLQVIVNTLPDDATGTPTPRKDAVGFLTGAKTYQFANPLVEVFRRAMEAKDPTWTLAHLRERWLVWATL